MFLRQFIKYLAVALALIMMACGNNKQAAPQAPPPPQVVVQNAIARRAVYFDEYPATVNPLNEITLRPQVSGFITGVYFKDGDRVKKGQLLYTIDQQYFAANLDQAVANLRVQEANLVRAQKDADRYHELAKNDAVAKQLVDNADAALVVAQRQADAARANIKGAQTNVRYTKVYAPFDGVIGISQVKPGAPVTAGQTILNTVSTDQRLAVDFNIGQADIYRFNKLMNDKSTRTDSTFTLAFRNEVYPFPGKLALLDRAVDPQTGTIKARLIFPNKNNLLTAGMNGTVRVSNSSENAILIPHKAITEQLGEFFVYVPGDSNKVSQRKVVLGRQIDSNIVVREGLKEGEPVVVQGVQNLREGMKVQIAQRNPGGVAVDKK
jgi:membrane fusion protein, multidrug efflux system